MRFWHSAQLGRGELLVWAYLLAVIGGIVAIEADAFGRHPARTPLVEAGGAPRPAALRLRVGGAVPDTAIADLPSISDPATVGETIAPVLTPPAAGAATASITPAPLRSYVLSDGREVIRTDFDLGSATLSRGGLEVSKPMTIDGRAVGEVAITINDASRLYISARDLRRVLPGDLAARVIEEDRFVAFDALRQSGIVIRYDPVSDVLQLST